MNQIKTCAEKTWFYCLRDVNPFCEGTIKAETRSKARYKAFLELNDVWPIKITDIDVYSRSRKP